MVIEIILRWDTQSAGHGPGWKQNCTQKSLLSKHSVVNTKKSAVTADLFTFKKETFNKKFYFLSSIFSVESFYHLAMWESKQIMFYLRTRNRVSGICKLCSTHVQEIRCLVLVNVLSSLHSKRQWNFFQQVYVTRRGFFKCSPNQY